ncbi:MAG: SusD/RagB family nutrient-binding outer membrane lipoprotein, partial [Daejeonella sp.]
MKIKYISMVLLTGLISLSACKKLTDGLDVNPNQPTDAPADLQLNGTEVASILVYEGNLARIGGIFSNSFSGSDRQYVEYENYNSNAPDYDDAWDILYGNVISNAKIGEMKATELNNKLQMGIFQVIQAQAFGTAASLWGDVPFTEASSSEFATPQFEAQADVYAKVQTLLDNAIANLSSGVGSGTSKDIFFSSDAAKWVATAYTLKARYFLHTKNYALAIAAAQQGILNPANNMMAPHGNTYNSDFNVYYSFTVYDRPVYLTADGAYNPMLLDASTSVYKGNAKTNEGARLNYLYQEDIYVGGLELNSLSADFDGSGPDDTGFFGSDAKFPL